MLTGKKRKKVVRANLSSVSASHQLIEINGAKFVSNLYWYQLSSVTRYMKEARDFGDKHNCDIVAIRRRARIQAGFVSRDSGALKGMYSLAASLAAILGDSWCGAFVLPDGRYAVVAVHDGMVAPGFDLIADRDVAMKRLGEAMNTFNYPDDAIFAPADFELAPAEKDIRTLLVAKALRSELRLKSLKFGMTQRELATIGGAVVAVALILLAFALWEHHVTEAEEQQAILIQHQRKVALDKLNETARKKLLLSALAHPWATQPNAADFLRACQGAIDALPLSISGWVFQAATCNSSALTANYARRTGVTQNQFVSGAQLISNLPVTFPTADTGTIGTLIKMPAGGDDAIPDADTAQQNLFSNFQALDLDGLSITADEKPVVLKLPTMPGVPQDPNLKPPAATWRQIHFIVKGAALEPDRLLAHYPDRSGVRIDSIQTTLVADKATLSWTIEGYLYAKK